jgi:hypothetical protein
MKTLKKFAFFGVLMIFCLNGSAQRVQVNKEYQKIRGVSAEGHSVEVEGTLETVTVSLTKFLRSFGRLKFAADPITVVEYVIGAEEYHTPFYAMTKSDGRTTVAWLGILYQDWTDTARAKSLEKELNRLAYDFGVKYYRDRVQVEIDESLRAMQTVERMKQKLTNENLNLNIKLENNKKEREHLEKSLDVNKLEYLNILTKLNQNKTSADSLSIVLEQVKKVVDLQKEKQRKIN